MKVGIDASTVGHHGGGIETYVRNLIRALGAVAPNEDYTLLFNASSPAGTIAGAEHLGRLVTSARYGPIRVPFRTSVALARAHIDVAHVQEAAPFLFPSKIVVTIHDLSFERYPQFFNPDIVRRSRIRVPLTLHRAAAVLTVSEFSKQDIVRRYCIPPERVTVAHGGPDPFYREVYDLAQLATVRERYGTGEHFILCVGDLQPRKNLQALIAAYVRLRREDATRHKLVLVGRKAWLYDDIFASARASGYVDELVFTGYVPDDDLVLLYNAADLFVYPSLFEGLGLPPLEAMACGTPVVTSNTSSLPEVVNGAALMVDPRDVDELAAVIARVLGDDSLRAYLTAAGRRRVMDYSWDITARTIRDVYHQVMQST